MIEAATARLNYGADIAIAVTNTAFSNVAKEKADELDVIQWDGKYLTEMFGWDGRSFSSSS